MNGNVDDHAVGQLDVFEKIENSPAETRLDFSRLRFGAAWFGFSA